MKVIKNDNVVILSGKYKGSTGKVLKVFTKHDRIIVEGVNIIKRHTKPSQKNQQGGIIEKEGSIDVSNVMVICGKCNQPTRVGFKILDDGAKVRVCKNKECGEIISN